MESSGRVPLGSPLGLNMLPNVEAGIRQLAEVLTGFERSSVVHIPMTARRASARAEMIDLAEGMVSNPIMHLGV